MKYLIPFAALFFVLTAGPLTGGELYKWRDSNGVLHFSNVASDSGAENVETSKETTGSPVTKKRVKKSQKDAKSEKKEDSRYSSCRETISQTSDSIETYLASARKNMRGGYITRENYNKLRTAMMTLKNEMSISDCVHAKGVDKKMYDCLGDTYGDIINCGFKYKEEMK